MKVPGSYKNPRRVDGWHGVPLLASPPAVACVWLVATKWSAATAAATAAHCSDACALLHIFCPIRAAVWHVASAVRGIPARARLGSATHSRVSAAGCRCGCRERCTRGAELMVRRQLDTSLSPRCQTCHKALKALKKLQPFLFKLNHSHTLFSLFLGLFRLSVRRSDLTVGCLADTVSAN